LNSKTTANKVNPQTKFSDLEDGSKLAATPIFGKKSASEFSSTLQSELNIVDDKGQLVPMTVTESDNHGFAKDVSYTLNGTTKKVTVSYNLEKPTVSFSNGTTMNFTSASEANTNLTKLVTAKITNGDDANGNTNTPKLSSNPASVTASGAVVFTPSDIYGDGIPATGTVNLYSAPTVPARAVSTAEAAKNPIAFTATNEQRFLATPTDTSDLTAIKYNVAAIDSAGNPVNDSATGDAIIFKGVTGKATVTENTTDVINYTMVFKDAKTGNVVLTKDTTGKSGDTIDSDAANALLAGTNYKLSGDQTATLNASTTEVNFTVTKPVNTTVLYQEQSTD